MRLSLVVIVGIVWVSLLLSSCELTGISDDEFASLVWERTSDDLRLSDLSATPDGIVFGLSSRPSPDSDRKAHVIVRSTDDGETWSDLLTIAEEIHDLSIHLRVSSSGTVFVIASPLLSEASPRDNTGRLYRSRNDGDDWESFEGLPWEGTGFATSIAVSQDGTLYVGTGGNPGVQAVYRSDDEGEKWDQTAIRSDSLGAVFSPLYAGGNGVLFVIANNEYLLRSGDRGRTLEPASTPWTDIILPQGLEANLWMSPSNTLFAVGNDGSASFLFRSTDLGSSWRQVGPPNIGINDLVFTDLEKGILSGVDGARKGVLVSTDGGIHWERAVEGLPTTSTGELRGDAGDLLIGPDGHIYMMLLTANPIGDLYRSLGSF